MTKARPAGRGNDWRGHNWAGTTGRERIMRPVVYRIHRRGRMPSGIGKSPFLCLEKVTIAKRRLIMPFRVSGKNIDIGDALRTRISDRIAEATKKYFDGGFSGHVVVAKEAFGFRTECVIHLDSGIVLEAEAFAADAYLSADQTAERIEKRLRRYKRRLKSHPTRADGFAKDPDSALNTQSYVIATP